MTRDAVTIDELVVGDDPEAWRAAGFTMDGDVCRVGKLSFRLAGTVGGRGILGWSLAGLDKAMTDVDGVPTSGTAADDSEAPEHPNGIVSVDHVVLATPHLARTQRALAALGWEPRRERDGRMGDAPVRQVFYRPGGVILEVVGDPEATGDGPSSLWGVTFTVTDIEAAAGRFGSAASPIRDAVQPGRKILTLRHRELGLSLRSALMTPHVRPD